MRGLRPAPTGWLRAALTEHRRPAPTGWLSRCLRPATTTRRGDDGSRMFVRHADQHTQYPPGASSWHRRGLGGGGTRPASRSRGGSGARCSRPRSGHGASPRPRRPCARGRAVEVEAARPVPVLVRPAEVDAVEIGGVAVAERECACAIRVDHRILVVETAVDLGEAVGGVTRTVPDRTAASVTWGNNVRLSWRIPGPGGIRCAAAVPCREARRAAGGE